MAGRRGLVGHTRGLEQRLSRSQSSGRRLPDQVYTNPLHLTRWEVSFLLHKLVVTQRTLRIT